ncbi:phosphopantetheine-binding protein [Ideonella sp.]|jgi:acyl carrier protein|uniref:phosphopantetheine-binding protein n=1 Tax=Ideonella sp. TaxID=1929293 RepID=UPI0037BF84C0
MSQEAAIARIVAGFLTQRHTALGRSGTPSLQDAVFESNLIDSLALIDLVALIEGELGCEVDMLVFDPSEVVTADDLSRALARATV